MQSLSITKDGRVFLRLPGKAYKSNRCVGKLKDQTLYVDRDPAKHLFRLNQAYGFNYEAVKTANFRVLCVRLPFGECLYTTKSFLLAHGTFLHFQRNQLDRQIFLPVEDFGLEKALAWEREQSAMNERSPKQEKVRQLGLFGGAL